MRASQIFFGIRVSQRVFKNDFLCYQSVPEGFEKTKYQSDPGILHHLFFILLPHFFFCATVGTGTGIIFESRNGVIWGGVISELCAGHRHDLTGTERGPE